MQSTKWVYYFLSPEWDKVNRAQLSKHKKCKVCGKPAKISVYVKERRDPMKTTVSDLESRCWKCYIGD